MSSGSPTSAKAATILLVDDSPRVRPLVRQILTDAGWNVLEAGRPEEALRLLEGREPEIDLLLTDIMMPGMSGVELAHRAKAERPGIRVLCMSGFDVYEGVQEGVEFIAKPFHPTALVEKIRDMLE
ncbi:MAG TPA: response regulator [Bryobacteraceae bacterium]|jgi:DNA-binding response OmpR family regulator|nr:response regulator [Bryobacteraceae bacterium]